LTYSTHEGNENCIQNFNRKTKKGEIFKKTCENVDWIPLSQDFFEKKDKSLDPLKGG
jgi:hypothetical protein